MQAIYYLIKRSTLVEIADAIREVKGLDSSIPVSKLDDVLRGILSRSTARSTEHEEYLIKLQTLIDIADAARELLGTSERIVVEELAKRILDILNKKKQLATPYIWLETVDEPVGDRTPAILGIAILGKTILGDYSTGLPQLRAPVIYLEEVSELPRLATPVIYLETEDGGGENEPDEPVIVKLATPVIYLEEVEEGGTDEPDEPEQLEAPVIYLEEIEKPERPIVIIFEEDVIVGDSNQLLLSSENLLESGRLDYIISVDGREYALDNFKRADIWSDEYLFNGPRVTIAQTGSGTEFVYYELGEVGTTMHIKIYYYELPKLEPPVIRLEEVEVVPAKLASPLIYLETVVFEGDVTTADTSIVVGSMTLNGTYIVIDEELLDSSVDSYTVEIDGVEYVCKLTLGDYMWSVTENPFAEDNTIIISKTGDSRTLIASTLFAEAGEVHRIKITETVEKPVSYIGTVWAFNPNIDPDTWWRYMEENGDEWGVGAGFWLPFDIGFTVPDGILSYVYDDEWNVIKSSVLYDFKRIECHLNGDEGDAWYYYPADEAYQHSCVCVDGAFDGQYPEARIIKLNEEPSEKLLKFLNTFASRAYLIPSGDYALTTSPAEDVYAILDAAELENVLPFSIYVKFTNVTEAGENSGLEFDHIDISESGIVYVYDDDADHYVECYADPDDGDLTFFTVLEDTYVSEIEYKVFEALKLYDSNLENDN